MPRLRERLRESSPELHAALERSWQFAHEEWLPAIAPAEDSSNSYPHLRNLEKYLDQIVAEYEALHGPAAPPLLSPIETYVMLSAILHHDIGRIQKEKNHGTASAEIVTRDYAHLAIPSVELAKVMAPIVAFHALSPKECEGELRNKLKTVAVSPYGEIRQRACAALLLLIDRLDGAFTRVAPSCLLPNPQAVGAFRRAVRAVEVDLRGQVVRVVLSQNLEADTEGKPASGDDFCIALDDDLDPKSGGPADGPMKAVVDLLRSVGIDFQKSRRTALFSALPGNQALTEALTKLPEWDAVHNRVFPEGSPNNDLVSALELNVGERAVSLELVARGWLRVNPKADGVQSEWPHDLLLAIILGDTWQNTEALNAIRPVLSAIGVPVKGWLLEYKERLYNCWGRETYEPIFYEEYLVRVAQAMWELSTRVFAHNTFSYETLAAQMREPDVERVRRAVWRIGIAYGPPDGKDAPFWAGQDRWRWVVQSRKHGREHCSYVAFDEVKLKLELKSPEGEQQ